MTTKGERIVKCKGRGCLIRRAARDFSKHGYCLDCGIAAAAKAAQEMADKSGPTWEKWREGMARAAREA